MTAPAEVQQPPTVRRPRRISRATVLILGVLVVPFVLSVALNEYGGHSVEGSLRMAFASVAGQTIAILSAIAAIVLTVTRRYAWPAIVGFVIIALVITQFAIGNMASAGDLLLERLELIAETDELNR
jgi:Co/Zn/Cd efflux system component